MGDLGNSVIVVEHDEETMLASDHIIDIGLEAGIHGGKVIAEGGINTIKKNKQSNKYFHLVGGGATCWVIWQSTTLLGIVLGEAIPDKLGLSFAVPLTFLALLVNDFRKLINVVVIIISGLVATIGFNYIPFKAYVIVSALIGLFTAMILTKVIKK